MKCLHRMYHVGGFFEYIDKPNCYTMSAFAKPAIFNQKDP